MEDARQLIGRLLDDRYLLKALVGTGGTAAVFRAEDLLLHRTVALKLLRQADDADEETPAAREAAAIRGKIPPNSSLVALCVEGKPHSSEELARLVRTWQDGAARHLVFVIGGSFGLAESLKKEAKVRLSMSPMTFPHHLARVMVLEQIYRAFKINEGSSYHK